MYGIGAWHACCIAFANSEAQIGFRLLTQVHVQCHIRYLFSILSTPCVYLECQQSGANACFKQCPRRKALSSFSVALQGGLEKERSLRIWRQTSNSPQALKAQKVRLSCLFCNLRVLPPSLHVRDWGMACLLHCVRKF